MNKKVYAFIDKAHGKSKLNTEYLYIPYLSKFYTYMKRSQNIAKEKNVELMFIADICEMLLSRKIKRAEVSINIDTKSLLDFNQIKQKISDIEKSTTKRGVNKNKASYSESRRLLKKLRFLNRNKGFVQNIRFIYIETSFLKNNINTNVLKETEIQGLNFKRVENVPEKISRDSVKIHVDASTKGETSSIAVKVVDGFKDIQVVKTFDNFKFTTQAEYMAMGEGLKIAKEIIAENPEKKIYLYGDSLSVVNSMNCKENFDKFIKKEEKRAENNKIHLESIRSMKESYKIIEESWKNDEPQIVVLKIDRELNAADKVLRTKK